MKGAHLGPFELQVPLASGGFGTVWRAVHAPTSTIVALKVLRPAHDSARAAFAREIRATARLDHPAVLAVHDHGTLGPAAAALGLDPAAPWYAMELCPGGTLGSAPPARWEALRRVLEQILAGLAHAHARGILHRDLKPDNVLWTEDGRIKLADFGIAHALRTAPDPGTPAVSGTPGFMAPEQICGDWRDEGPHTDLYALGCLGWELVTGQPLFPVEGSDAVLRAHLLAPLPPLRPRLEVPAGLEDWLGDLLEKSTERRLPLAADAAWALQQLGPARLGAAPLAPSPSLSTQTTWTEELPRPLPPPEAGPALERAPPPLSELPDASVRARPRLPRGLGMYGLRVVPVVGRAAEQTALWSALGRVHTERRPATVALVGAAGTGKSRLAAWLLERAHETGAAFVLASHGDADGGGLGAMVRRALGLQGHGRRQAARRLVELAPSLAHGLLSWVYPDATPAEERRAALRQWIRIRAGARALVLWLDDAQWDEEAWAVAEALCEDDGAGPVPVLVVLTLREDALDEGHRERLRALGAVEHEVAPLDLPGTRALVRELLGLDDALAARVEERCAGNPLFAVQLVGDWVQRGFLAQGAHGLVLVPGAGATLPDDLAQVGADRVRAWLAGQPPGAELCLELAAAIGAEVEEGTWRWLCRRAGSPPPHGFVEALVDARLGVASRDGHWRFAHGMLREAVQRAAERAGRWAGHHELCAEWLAQHGDPEPGRRGRHLLRAGRAAEAVGPLLEGMRRSVHSEPRRALALHADVEEAIAAQADPEPDRARAAVLRAYAHTSLGALEAARTWAERACGASDPQTHAEALLSLGRTALRQKRLDTADAELALAEEAFRHLGDRRALLRTELERAAVDRYRGDLPRAVERYRAAEAEAGRLGDAELCIDAATRLGSTLADAGSPEAADWLRRALLRLSEHPDALGEAAALMSLTRVYTRAGNWPAARDLAERTREAFTRAGDTRRIADAVNLIADVDRLAGHLDEAQRGYELSLRLRGGRADPDAHVVIANLGMVALERGDLNAARVRFTEALQRAERGGLLAWVAIFHCCVLVCCAHDDDAWARHLAAAEEGLGATGVADEDLLEVLERARQEAVGAGRDSGPVDALIAGQRAALGLG